MTPPPRTNQPKGEGTPWYVDVDLRSGLRFRMVGFKSRKLTEELAERIEALDEHREAGVPLSVEMRQWLGRLNERSLERLLGAGLLSPADLDQARTLDDHLDDFEAHLRARANTRKHVRTNMYRVRAVLTGINARRWEQVRVLQVEVWLAELRERRSIRTSNAYLLAVRQFCRWAVKNGRIQIDPLKSLDPLDDRRALKKRRRALSLDEQRRLLLAAKNGPVRGRSRSRATGPQRGLMYLLALETGLRQDEVRQLCLNHLRLDLRPPRIVFQGEEVKGRRDQMVALRRRTARLLKEEIAERPEDARLFPWMPGSRACLAWLRRDLDLAGIAHRDAQGRDVDWHALRKSAGSLFQNSHHDLDATARMLRHEDVRTTREHYLDDDMGELGRMVEETPDIFPEEDVPPSAEEGDEE